MLWQHLQASCLSNGSTSNPSHGTVQVIHIRHEAPFLAVLSPCQLPISTAALDKNSNSSQFWLEMFKTVSESVSIGMVVADMNVPGCPLAYINEGFKTVTGERLANIYSWPIFP